MTLRKILAAALSLTIAVTASEFSFGGSVLHGDGLTAAAVSELYENPFDRQDDEEVPYDGSYWIQPREWNVPKINTKEYDGGIMLYFDKISMDAEYARGKTQRVYFSVSGVKESVGMVRFHIFYDTRLKVEERPNGEVVTAGRAVEGFATGSVKVEEGQLEFYAYSNEKAVADGCLFTLDFTLPEDADEGEVYPFGIIFVRDDVGSDVFINTAQDDAGRLQMAYVFTKGIYNGWIRMNGEKRRKKEDFPLGDPTGDGKVDSKDASFVLVEYALRSTDADVEPLPPEIEAAADVNRDGLVDARDASAILAYYAHLSTGGKLPIEVYLGYADVVVPTP